MRLHWEKMPEIFKGQKMWGATHINHSFIITYDPIECEGYLASAKAVDGVPFDGTRQDIGGVYNTFHDAQVACEKFLEGTFNA